MTTSVTRPGLPLSPRERQVLSLIAAGHTDQQIATQLYIGVDTAKTIAKRIYIKFEVTNRAAAVNAGWERGLLGGGETSSARAQLVVSELLDEHAEPIHWEAWKRILGDRFAAKQDRELTAQLEQAQVSPMPWLHAGRTA
jgi:DNA-binding CsgD family transcriptional regulator